MRDSRKSPGPVSVERYPTDVSPYGVRHLAGNAWTWCLDPYQPRPPIEDGERYLIPDLGELDGGRCGRGGDWYSQLQNVRSARRLRALSGSYRDGSLTFRLCRPLVPSRDG